MESSYKYLINIEGRAKNCVRECPQDTKLKEYGYECIEKEFETSNVMIIIGVVGGFILLIIVIKICSHLNKILLNTKERTVMKEMDTKTPLTLE